MNTDTGVGQGEAQSDYSQKEAVSDAIDQHSEEIAMRVKPVLEPEAYLGEKL